MIKTVLTLFMSALLALSVSACGKKGPPTPPVAFNIQLDQNMSYLP